MADVKPSFIDFSELEGSLHRRIHEPQRGDLDNGSGTGVPGT